MVISPELLHIIRAILFGITFGYAVFYFFVFFKPITEDALGKNKIDVDFWWWLGIGTSVISGIIVALLMMTF